MTESTLVIGSPHLSSWSLRGWLLLRQFGLAFREVVVELDRPDTRAKILAYSPAAKTPVLVDGAETVWESLAIAEHLADRYPELGIWPADAVARSRARVLAAEMHAGFRPLREALPMDLREARPGVPISPEVRADIDRIVAAWGEARNQFGAGGPFLFGAFSAADAMFAPVVVRFVTYGVALDSMPAAYCEAVWTLPAMDEWRRLAGAG